MKEVPDYTVSLDEARRLAREAQDDVGEAYEKALRTFRRYPLADVVDIEVREATVRVERPEPNLSTV